MLTIVVATTSAADSGKIIVLKSILYSMYTIITVCTHSILKGHNIRKLFNLSFTFIYYLLRIMSNLIHIDEKNFNLFPPFILLTHESL